MSKKVLRVSFPRSIPRIKDIPKKQRSFKRHDEPQTVPKRVPPITISLNENMPFIKSPTGSPINILVSPCSHCKKNKLCCKVRHWERSRYQPKVKVIRLTASKIEKLQSKIKQEKSPEIAKKCDEKKHPNGLIKEGKRKLDFIGISEETPVKHPKSTLKSNPLFCKPTKINSVDGDKTFPTKSPMTSMEKKVSNLKSVPEPIQAKKYNFSYTSGKFLNPTSSNNQEKSPEMAKKCDEKKHPNGLIKEGKRKLDFNGNLEETPVKHPKSTLKSNPLFCKPTKFNSVDGDKTFPTKSPMTSMEKKVSNLKSVPEPIQAKKYNFSCTSGKFLNPTSSNNQENQIQSNGTKCLDLMTENDGKNQMSKAKSAMKMSDEIDNLKRQLKESQEKLQEAELKIYIEASQFQARLQEMSNHHRTELALIQAKYEKQAPQPNGVVHLKWICPVCDVFDEKPEENDEMVLKHIVFGHAKGILDVPCHRASSGDYECSFCLLRFGAYDSYLFHLVKFHDLLTTKILSSDWPSQNLSPITSRGGQDLRFRCLHCFISFKDRKWVELHAAMKHYMGLFLGPNSEDVCEHYSCPVTNCTISCKTREGLIKHIIWDENGLALLFGTKSYDEDVIETIR